MLLSTFWGFLCGWVLMFGLCVMCGLLYFWFRCDFVCNFGIWLSVDIVEFPCQLVAGLFIGCLCCFAGLNSIWGGLVCCCVLLVFMLSQTAPVLRFRLLHVLSWLSCLAALVLVLGGCWPHAWQFAYGFGQVVVTLLLVRCFAVWMINLGVLLVDYLWVCDFAGCVGCNVFPVLRLRCVS